MAKDSDPQVRIIPPQSGGPPAIVLPCPPDHFREFIAGLLGKPQTIERYLDGPIEITRDDAENLYHLLDQRISSQNDATLIQFTARIVYDDNSSVLLNSFLDFHSYNEVKPLTSTGLHLSWTYLVQFKNKSFPERQNIDISIVSKPSYFQAFHETAPAFMWAERKGPFPAFMRIQHTDRSWGVDIEALLKGQIETLTKIVSPARRFTNKYSGPIGFVTATLAVLVCLLISYGVSEHYSLRYISQAAALKNIDGDTLAHQIDFLIGIVASGAWTRFSLTLMFLMIAVLVAAIICGAAISERASMPSPSFVLLTNKAVEAKNAHMRRIKQSWYLLAASIAGTLLLGVLGNFIFYLCIKWWGP